MKRSFQVCLGIFAYLAAGSAVLELYQIGWGTGVWLGQFAPYGLPPFVLLFYSRLLFALISVL
jgi:hypothetical protein